MDITSDYNDVRVIKRGDRKTLLKLTTNQNSRVDEPLARAEWVIPQGGIDNVIGWCIRGFCCDKSWYNFEDPYMTLVLVENGANITINITNGNYTPLTFATAVAAALNLAGANTYSVTFNNITEYYTIQRTAGALTWTIDWSLSPVRRYLGHTRLTVFPEGNPLIVSTDRPSFYRTLSINLKSATLGGTEITSGIAVFGDNVNLTTVINVEYTIFAGTTLQEQRLIAFNDHDIDKSYNMLVNPIKLTYIDFYLTYDDALPVKFNKPFLGFAVEVDLLIDDSKI